MPNPLPRPLYVLAWLTGAAPEVPATVWAVGWRIARLIGTVGFLVTAGYLAATC